ncbi:MAG TPA: hypothetical protein VKR59_14060 [Terriglobales bacterium]|nr:hypothetical protein [Terriglobales bacterium]
MRFEERELENFATFVLARDLKEGAVYFATQYVDDKMLLPIMRPVVFIGKNLEPGDTDRVYFQDVGSYRRGFRRDSPDPDTDAFFESFPETTTGDVSAIYEYEDVLDELMRCALRRRKA